MYNLGVGFSSLALFNPGYEFSYERVPKLKCFVFEDRKYVFDKSHRFSFIENSRQTLEIGERSIWKDSTNKRYMTGYFTWHGLCSHRQY